MNLGNFTEDPTQRWIKHDKIKDAIIGPPKMLGRTRKSLKFIIKIMKIHLRTDSAN